MCSTKESKRTEKEKDLVFKLLTVESLMKEFFKDSLKMISLMEREFSIAVGVPDLKDSGKIINLMERPHSLRLMVLSIQDIGKKMYMMVRVFSNGMVTDMKENGRRAKKMEKEFVIGRMEIGLKERKRDEWEFKSNYLHGKTIFFSGDVRAEEQTYKKGRRVG